MKWAGRLASLGFILLSACTTMPTPAGSSRLELSDAVCTRDDAAQSGPGKFVAERAATINIAAELEDPYDGCVGRSSSNALATPQARALSVLKGRPVSAVAPTATTTPEPAIRQSGEEPSR